MEVIDPGHKYSLASLDGGEPITLTFVKRDNPPEKYPGNEGHYPGTIMQENFRALIERLQYVNRQVPCRETTEAIDHQRAALRLLEQRHARRHGRPDLALGLGSVDCIEALPFCGWCGHTLCFCEATA